MPTSEHAPPVGGAVYRHPSRRGRWRIETAGPKWVTFRSLDMASLTRAGFVTFKERREDWPNGWTRA